MAKVESQIKLFFKNSVVFLTGGSGFLGKVLIEKLLRECEVKQIFLLMRHKKGKTPQERFDDLFDAPCFEKLKKKDEACFKKVHLIDGDCQKPLLGLNEENIELLAKETTCVIHAAANVKFDQSLKEAALNVRATKELIELAHKMPNLKSFIFVSTAYSNCIHQHIKEDFYEPPLNVDKLLSLVEVLDDEIIELVTPEILGKWPNCYVFTKSISEDLVKKNRENLPIAIVRPSIVVSSVAEPVPGWIDNFYGIVGVVFAAALGVLRTLYGKLDAEANLVPVDYVSNCVLAAAWQCASASNSNGKIYNLVGFGKTPLTWRLFAELVEAECWKKPTEKVLWYFCFKVTDSRFENRMRIIFLHTIPAYFVDFLLFCCGKPRLAVENYARLNKMLDLLSYFSGNSWNFEQKNVEKLWNAMNEEDRENFIFNMESLDMRQHTENCVMGGKLYLLKEDPVESVVKGKRKLKILFVAHYTFLCVFYFLLYKLIMFICGFFF